MRNIGYRNLPSYHIGSVQMPLDAASLPYPSSQLTVLTALLKISEERSLEPLVKHFLHAIEDTTRDVATPSAAAPFFFFSEQARF
jgi:hypothetical protein